MSTNNIGVLLRRFVAVCQTEADINTRPSHPLSRPPGEWPHLSDLLSAILQSCPPSRLAVLSFMHPIVVAHLQSIYLTYKSGKGDNISPQKRRCQPSISPSPPEAFILDVLSAALEVCKREAFIQDLPNSFAAELCTFALDLLGPICSPPYCNSQCYLKRKRKSNGPGPSSSHRRRRIKGPSSELDSTTEEASEIDELSGNESNTSGACESDSDALVVIEEDLQDESKSGVEESDISPDLRPNKFNLALLGNFWSYSAVVKQLLRIVFTCLVCQRYATAASVERLVACAVPAEIKGSKLSLYPAKHPMDITACIPHWCIKWLIRQVADAVGQNSGNQAIIDRFCRNLLDVCLRGPHRNGGCEYARFWAITGLANLVYVGIYFPDQLRASLTLWLEEKFAELERGSKSSSNLIHVLAPLVVLCPKDPATSDRYPQNVPPQRNRPRPSAMNVARGFLSHEFHSIFPCVHVREFIAICASMRCIALTTARKFLIRLSDDFGRLETLVENLLKAIPNGSFQELEYAVVDGICTTSEECACQCVDLLLYLHSSAPPTSTIFSTSQHILSLIVSRLQNYFFYKEPNRAEVPALLTFDCETKGEDFMRQFMEEGRSFAALLLIIRFCYSRSDSQALQFFKNIILWNVGKSKKCPVDKSKCPLLCFFSLLSEWVSINQTDKSAPTELLKSCLEDVLESIAQLSWAERKKALVNILWLLKREENLMKQEAGSGVKEARLNNAVNAILPKFPNLLLILVEEPQLAAFDVALHILEVINLNPSGFSRPAGDCICIGRRFSTLQAVLLDKLDNTTLETREDILSPYQRVLTLLTNLSNLESLIRSAALVGIAQAACEKYAAKERFLLFEPSAVSSLQDPSRPSELLLDNPPPEPTTKVTVTKGQLIRRNPPAASKSGGENGSYSTEWKPSTAFWVHLVRRLLMSSKEELNPVYQHCFGDALEDHILAHGLQLRQTDFRKIVPPKLPSSNDPAETQLQQQNPDQYGLGYHWFQLRQTYLHIRTPPKTQMNGKVVTNEPYEPDLDRIMALLRVFVPEWREAHPTNSEQVLWAFLDLILSPPLERSSSTKDEANDSLVSPFPAPRLILGLLLGLEVAWNSPLAPQVPLPTFDDDKDVESTLGAFPIPGFPALARQRARTLAINNSHRRIDTKSQLYKATEFLITRLAQFPYIPPSKKDAPEHKLPPPPIENLLCLLTPREMKFLINDIRHRLRDCVANKDAAYSGFFTITPEILHALTESHLTEEGVPELFPRLLAQYTTPMPHPATEAIAEHLEAILSLKEVSGNDSLLKIASDGEISVTNELDKTIDLEEGNAMVSD